MQGHEVEEIAQTAASSPLHTSQPVRLTSVPPSERTLIVGIGNPDRQDDGVGWHIVRSLAGRLGGTVLETLDDDLCQLEPSPVLVCLLQPIPEMAESLSCFDRVCFVDAHTGSYAEEMRFAELQPDYQGSPFTHHLTPQSCLALAGSLYGRAPKGVACSVRGYEFGFERSLSERTSALADQAIERICAWLEQASPLAEATG